MSPLLAVLPPLPRDLVGTLNLAGSALTLAYQAAGREGELTIVGQLDTMLDVLTEIVEDVEDRRLLPGS